MFLRDIPTCVAVCNHIRRIRVLALDTGGWVRGATAQQAENEEKEQADEEEERGEITPRIVFMTVAAAAAAAVAVF